MPLSANPCDPSYLECDFSREPRVRRLRQAAESAPGAPPTMLGWRLERTCECPKNSDGTGSLLAISQICIVGISQSGA
jgi:hypothetical protein